MSDLQGLDEESLSREKRANAHRRKQRFEDNINCIAVCFLWISAGGFSLFIMYLAGIWGYSFLYPEQISKEKIETIEAIGIYIVGGISGYLGNIAKRALDPSD